MNKPPDFSGDLSLVAEGVTAGVNDVLHALRHKSDRSTKVIETKRPPAYDAPVQKAVEPTEDESIVSSAAGRTRRSRPHMQARAVAVGSRSIAKERFTTRLTAETKELLEEAKNWQKVKRQVPDDYEDIVQEALIDWFRKMSYLK